jgi:iron complex outermembrane recepter protein
VNNRQSFVAAIKCAAAIFAPIIACNVTLAQGTASSTATTTSPSPVDSSGGEIAEIVVTAQRREESLQKSSVVIDVVSADRLERAGLTRAQDLMEILPGVQIGSVGPVTQVYIRGVGDFGSTAISNPAVAFNVDSVYVGRSQSLSSEFFDVARVEVLKGPQGTLYGRNASGGAINVVTADPTLDGVSGNVSTEFSNYNSQTLETAVNVPLSSTVAVRGSAQVVSKDGYTSDGFSDDKHQSARLKVLWKPNDTFSAILNGSYGHVGGLGAGFVLLNSLAGSNQYLDGTSPQARAYIAANQFIALPPGSVSSPGRGDAIQDLRFWNISADLHWTFDFADLVVLPAYRNANMRYAVEPSFLFDVGNPFGAFPERPETSHQTSVESRLSNNSDRLKWVTGLYYYDETQFVQNEVNSGLIQDVGQVSNLDSLSYAGFGQATFSVTDRFRLIGGARYTSDERKLTDGATYAINPTYAGASILAPPCLPPNPQTTCLLESYEGSRTFRNGSWKVGMEMDVAPESMLYATASTGFKAGGFNQTVAVDAPPGSTQASEFGPEKLLAYELGLRNRFFDDRLQINAEGFYWDYLNHQEAHVALSGNGVVGLDFQNAGNARIEGGSLDLVFKPFRSGTFHSAVEFADSKYTKFTYLQNASFLLPGSTACAVTPTTIVNSGGPVVSVNCSGFQMTRSPKWSGNGGYSQEFSLSGGREIEANIDVAFASQRWLAADFIPIERANAYATLDGSLAYHAREGWSVTGFVRNVTNSHVYSGAQEAPYSPGVAVASIGPPRMYGARLDYKF